MEFARWLDVTEAVRERRNGPVSEKSSHGLRFAINIGVKAALVLNDTGSHYFSV